MPRRMSRNNYCLCYSGELICRDIHDHTIDLKPSVKFADAGTLSLAAYIGERPNPDALLSLREAQRLRRHPEETV